jgi:hypothetical protein
MASKTPREVTEREALAPKDEKKVTAVIEAYTSAAEDVQKWAERYARKVVKVMVGIRTTPAPVPPELGKDEAERIDALLGYVRPERKKPEPKKPAAKKPAAKKAPAKKGQPSKAKNGDAEAEAASAEETAEPVVEENPLA